MNAGTPRRSSLLQRRAQSSGEWPGLRATLPRDVRGSVLAVAASEPRALLGCDVERPGGPRSGMGFGMDGALKAVSGGFNDAIRA